MPLPVPIAAIIFDLDGTLVNTEPVHCQAWLEVLAIRGFHYDEEWFQQWIGTADRYLAQGVIDEHELSTPARVLQREKEHLFHQLVVQKNQAFPGTEAALARLQKIVPLAIATNSAYRDTVQIFQRTPVDRYIKTIVTADDVTLLKPAPDMYLLAAELLGVDPEQCLVLEDSSAGSQAAAEAGMYVLGLTSSQPQASMSAAHEWYATPAAGMQRLEDLLSGV
jgi:HAD superfamily hydrolase (TIGR01509 family)